MGHYLPDGCTQDALDRYYGYDQPEENEEPEIEEELPEPPPTLWEHDGERYLNGERILTAREAYACARVLMAIDRAARELGKTDYPSALKMYELSGSLQYRMFGSACCRELGEKI